MKEVVINLRDRFKAIEDTLSLTDKDFAQAIFDYSAYIGDSSEASAIVKQMAKDFDIDRDVLHRLFLYGALRNGFRSFTLKKNDAGVPLFLDEEIEKEYHLGEGLLKLLAFEKYRTEKLQKMNLSIFDFVLSEDGKDVKENGLTNKEELFKFCYYNNIKLL